MNIFDLDYSRWEVISLTFVPALINLGLYFYIAFRYRKNIIVTYFSVFLFFISMWQFAEGAVRMSQTYDTAFDWIQISSTFCFLVAASGILFVFNYTRWIKKVHIGIFSAVLFLGSAFCFVIVIGDLHKGGLSWSETWYWIDNPTPNFFSIYIFCWIMLCSITMLVLLWWNYFTNKNLVEKRQAQLIAIGFTIPFIGGSIGEVITPLVLDLDNVPLTGTLFTAFSIFSFIAIKKFRLLDYSPKNQWEQIIDSMNEGLMIVDNQDRIMFANSTFCQLMGYQFEELKDKVAAEVFVDDAGERKKIEQRIEERKQHQSGQYEIQLKTKSGHKLWMLTSGSPYINHANEVIGSIGVFTDITRLKETEKALYHSETRLNEAQAFAHLGSWELSFSTGIAVWSAEACRIYGYRETENTHTFEEWISFIHPDDLPRVNAIIEESQKTLATIDMFHRIVWKDGTVKHIHSLSKFEFNERGEPVGLFGICFDITEQFATREALRESEEHTRTFINESLVSIYFVDPITKKILYANPAFSQLLGYSPEETLALTVYDFVDHTVENINERIDEAMEKRKIDIGERKWKKKDGSSIIVLVNTFYQKRNGIETIYVIGQNITERKTTEELLISTNKELETFIYKASHDLRSPLASIIGLINVSKREIKDEVALTYLKLIELASQKLDYTLLELVKAMHIKDIHQFTDKIIFSNLLDQVLERFTHHKNFGGIHIERNILFNKEFISSSFIIETILQNLIENSIKYQKTNAVDPFIKITISGNEQVVQIKIEDNGIGIDPTIHNKIFDIYFRGTQISSGSGLGLYLVKKGIEKLKGSIELQSTPCVGTVFTITLHSTAFNSMEMKENNELMFSESKDN